MTTPSNIAWRYTALKVRLGPFDASIVVPPVILFLMHIHVWTLVLAFIAIVSMWVIELFFHMPLVVVLRALRSFMAGPKRSAVPWWKQNSL